MRSGRVLAFSTAGPGDPRGYPGERHLACRDRDRSARSESSSTRRTLQQAQPALCAKVLSELVLTSAASRIRRAQSQALANAYSRSVGGDVLYLARYGLRRPRRRSASGSVPPKTSKSISRTWASSTSARRRLEAHETSSSWPPGNAARRIGAGPNITARLPMRASPGPRLLAWSREGGRSRAGAAQQHHRAARRRVAGAPSTSIADAFEQISDIRLCRRGYCAGAGSTPTPAAAAPRDDGAGQQPAGHGGPRATAGGPAAPAGVPSSTRPRRRRARHRRPAARCAEHPGAVAALDGEDRPAPRARSRPGCRRRRPGARSPAPITAMRVVVRGPTVSPGHGLRIQFVDEVELSRRWLMRWRQYPQRRRWDDRDYRHPLFASKLGDVPRFPRRRELVTWASSLDGIAGCQQVRPTIPGVTWARPGAAAPRPGLLVVLARPVPRHGAGAAVEIQVARRDGRRRRRRRILRMGRRSLPVVLLARRSAVDGQIGFRLARRRRQAAPVRALISAYQRSISGQGCAVACAGDRYSADGVVATAHAAFHRAPALRDSSPSRLRRRRVDIVWLSRDGPRGWRSAQRRSRWPSRRWGCCWSTHVQLSWWITGSSWLRCTSWRRSPSMLVPRRCWHSVSSSARFPALQGGVGRVLLTASCAATARRPPEQLEEGLEYK